MPLDAVNICLSSLTSAPLQTLRTQAYPGLYIAEAIWCLIYERLNLWTFRAM